MYSGCVSLSDSIPSGEWAAVGGGLGPKKWPWTFWPTAAHHIPHHNTLAH